jgi:hypothetical protein
MNKERYFITEEREVSREEFIRYEQAAGFFSKQGSDSVATGGFSSGSIKGSVRYSEESSLQDSLFIH